MATDRQIQNSKSVLRSWLTAAKVEFVSVPNGIILSKSGRVVEVGHKTDLASRVAVVDGSVLVSSNAAQGATYFVESMRELGIDIRMDQIVRKGDLSTFGKRTKASDCIEDVIMRHNEFRMAPNPNPAVLAAYKPMIKSVVREMGYRFLPLMQRLCWDSDDLTQYATVWVVNYIHKYSKGVLEEDISLARVHLYQRLGEMMMILRRQERNLLPDEGTLQACDEDAVFVRTGSVEDDAKREKVIAKNYDIVELLEPEPERLGKTVAARKANNQRIWTKLFGNLTKEQQVQKLREVYENEHCDPDARLHAGIYLKKLGKTDIEEDMGDIEGGSGSDSE